MSDYYGHGGGGGESADGGQQQPQQQQQHRQSSGGRGPYKNYNNNNTYNNTNNNVNMDTGKIFVGGLSWQTTEESLRWHFEQYGPVLSVEVMRDRNTGDPRGFAFVVFKDGASTVDIVMAEEIHEINHKIVDVKRAQARGIAPPSIHRPSDGSVTDGGENSGTTGAIGGVSSVGAGGGVSHHQDNNNNQQQVLTPEMAQNKVFVGGLPLHVDRDGLRELLSEYGTVVDAIVMLDQTTKRSRGFGFVTFEAGCNGAQRAVDAQPLNIQGRRVEVKLAMPRAEQQRRPIMGGGGMGMGGAGGIGAGGHPKHVGLRAGQSSSSVAGEFAGLAVAYGRNGWKAGYGSTAFGKSGWAVQGWEDSGGWKPIERSGFSFSLLQQKQKRVLPKQEEKEEPAAKRMKQ